MSLTFDQSWSHFGRQLVPKWLLSFFRGLLELDFMAAYNRGCLGRCAVSRLCISSTPFFTFWSFALLPLTFIFGDLASAYLVSCVLCLVSCSCLTFDVCFWGTPHSCNSSPIFMSLCTLEFTSLLLHLWLYWAVFLFYRNYCVLVSMLFVWILCLDWVLS